MSEADNDKGSIARLIGNAVEMAVGEGSLAMDCLILRRASGAVMVLPLSAPSSDVRHFSVSLGSSTIHGAAPLSSDPPQHYTVACDASSRTVSGNGLVASIGVAVRDRSGSIVKKVSEIVPGWSNKKINRLELRALRRGLEIACALQLKNVLLISDNEHASSMMIDYLRANRRNQTKAVRAYLESVESIVVRKATKVEVKTAHDLANQAAASHLARLSRRSLPAEREDTDDRSVISK